jgi:radical SAM superfamily enzyme YgiQ (UPF0313 family)
MYKAKRFRIRPLQEVLEDFQEARRQYGVIERIFLADGDALIRKTSDLVQILSYVKENIPECRRVTTYGTPQSIRLKSPEDLKALKDLGLSMVYLGLESGSDEVLKKTRKASGSEEIVSAGLKVKAAGMQLSVTAISGLGGKELWREHAIGTAKALSAMNPEYIGLLTLLMEEGTELYEEWRNGKFILLTPEEVLSETLLMLENIDSEGSVFRSNHPSNYVQLRGTLNADRERMIELLRRAQNGDIKLRNEAFRAF